LQWLGAGTGHWIEDTMSHDKISAAARQRMTETGESYAAARRAVIREHQAAGGHPANGERTSPPGQQWFTISYSDTWSGRLSDSLDRLLFRAGRGVSGVAVDTGEIRVRMGSFKLDIPRSSAEGLAELAIDPPVHVSPSIDTLYGLGPSQVRQLTLSLDDPDGFVVAVEGDSGRSR
jgi:hypothetical protein